MRLHPPGRAFAAALAAALCACGRGAPPPAPPAFEESEPARDVAPPAHDATDVVVIPPFDPSLPSLTIERSPAVAAHAPSAKSTNQRAAKRAARIAAAPQEPPAPNYPPLDVLLRAPSSPGPGDSANVDLNPSGAEVVKPKPPDALDRLGQSIRLERHQEAIGPAGPRQGYYYETDAGVRIPVDKEISLEGGVRVDERDDPGANEQDQRRPTPRVGVEVKF